MPKRVRVCVRACVRACVPARVRVKLAQCQIIILVAYFNIGLVKLRSMRLLC